MDGPAGDAIALMTRDQELERALAEAVESVQRRGRSPGHGGQWPEVEQSGLELAAVVEHGAGDVQGVNTPGHVPPRRDPSPQPRLGHAGLHRLATGEDLALGGGQREHGSISGIHPAHNRGGVSHSSRLSAGPSNSGA